ncbi:Translation initiation factor 4B (eIF-4B) [Komagataella phaffii CBS 7435]|nr:GQ67_04184T0 [Komagataella phaffii]CAH2449044.1 Translation initiation factor 4B (eIF-4B) [Komagataella phaffii CBS 7435]CCA39086.1 Translation initiation factor 4B (eIF-4B) [Komagataella phaffii CBS 7435]
MAPKKMTKMDLGSFLEDDSFGGSWADDDVDMSAVSLTTAIPLPPPKAPIGTLKRDRVNYPIPRSGPYKAVVNNLPWDINEETFAKWLDHVLSLTFDSIVELSMPMDVIHDRPKGFAFVTFNKRSELEQAVNSEGLTFNGRSIYISVASPERDESTKEFDWSNARGSAQKPSSTSREEHEFDWDNVRGSAQPAVRERRAPREPREEIDLDWGARGTAVPKGREPRESRESREPRPPRREEPELDWGARGTAVPKFTPREPREPREQRESGEPREQKPFRPRKQEVEFDWSARGSAVPKAKEPREHSKANKPKKPEPELRWESLRANNAQKKEEVRPTSSASATSVPQEKKDAHRVKQSLFHVLADQSDDDGQNIQELENQAADLALNKD